MEILDYLETLIELLIVAYFLVMRARKALKGEQPDEEDESAEQPSPDAMNETLVVEEPPKVAASALELEPIREGQRLALAILKRLRELETVDGLLADQRLVVRAHLDGLMDRGLELSKILGKGLTKLQRETPPLTTEEAHEVNETLRLGLGSLTLLVADVDAIAQSVVKLNGGRTAQIFGPVLELAREMDSKDGGAATTPWICLPESPIHAKCLSEGLAPNAVLFIPDDAESEPLMWGSIAQAICLQIVTRLPDLYLATTPPSPPWLPRLQGRQVYVDFDAHMRHWGAFFAADALTVMLLGPAAVEALLFERALSDFDIDEDELTCGDDARLVGAKPPMHLRLPLALQVLTTRGFRDEATVLESRWADESNLVTNLRSPSLFDEHVRLPISAYVEYGSRLILDEIVPVLEEAVSGKGSLQHLPLMTGPQWVETRGKSLALLAGQNVVVASHLRRLAIALCAAAEEPGASNRILAWLLDGLSPDIRTQQIVNKNGLSTQPETNLAFLRQAFILREILQRPHSRSPLTRPNRQLPRRQASNK